MKPSPFLKQVAAELSKYKSRINAQQFFKEKLDQPWMLKSAVFKQLANDIWETIREKSKKEIFDLCEELLASDLEARKGLAFDFDVPRVDRTH